MTFNLKQFIRIWFRVAVIGYTISRYCGQCGAKEIKMDINWILTSLNSTRNIDPIYQVEVPSGVYTELERHGKTESVLFSKNDVELRWIGESNWQYQFDFQGMI